MARQSEGTISSLVLSLADKIVYIIMLDLYNKSRMMGDYHVRFCERLSVKLPLPTRQQTLAVILRKHVNIEI